MGTRHHTHTDIFPHSQKISSLVHVKKQGASGRKGYSHMEELQSGEVMKQQKVRSGPSSNLPEVGEDYICHLSGKPFFDVVLTKSQIYRSCPVNIPANITQLLPSETVPVVLMYGDKNWSMSYVGDSVRPKFSSEWRGFVVENELKCGDACVFELTENTSRKLKFKVHVLRCALPPELLAMIDSCGMAMDSPIVID